MLHLGAPENTKIGIDNPLHLARDRHVQTAPMLCPHAAPSHFVFLLAMQIPVRFRYRIERRQARWNVVFPELSSANFTADSPARARTEAPEKALTALARLLLKSSEAVPVCQRAHAGEGEAVLPLFAQGKARFIERAWALQVQAADVARALGITRQEAARLFDLAHPTKIDALSKALEVLGAQLDLSLSLLPQGPSPLLNEKPRRGRTPKSAAAADDAAST